MIVISYNHYAEAAFPSPLRAERQFLKDCKPCSTGKWLRFPHVMFLIRVQDMLSYGKDTLEAEFLSCKLCAFIHANIHTVYYFAFTVIIFIYEILNPMLNIEYFG